jgi:hypothetical protein
LQERLITFLRPCLCFILEIHVCSSGRVPVLEVGRWVCKNNAIMVGAQPPWQYKYATNISRCRTGNICPCASMYALQKIYFTGPEKKLKKVPKNQTNGPYRDTSGVGKVGRLRSGAIWRKLQSKSLAMGYADRISRLRKARIGSTGGRL